MIDFACKQFNLDDIIKCGLGLTKADYNVLKFMLKNKKEKFSTSNLQKELNLNLSTIQKGVKKLTEKDIVQRLQKNLNNGGYIYFYKIKNREYIRKIIMDIVYNWVKKVDEELSRW